MHTMVTTNLANCTSPCTDEDTDGQGKTEQVLVVETRVRLSGSPVRSYYDFGTIDEPLTCSSVDLGTIT